MSPVMSERATVTVRTADLVRRCNDNKRTALEGHILMGQLVVPLGSGCAVTSDRWKREGHLQGHGRTGAQVLCGRQAGRLSRVPSHHRLS